MDNGSRETRCTICAHREVCAYKHKYLETMKMLEDLFFAVIHFGDGDLNFLVFSDPGCKFFK